MQESLQARPNSHELFGYDFVVDQALNVWLIEVNCSPSLEHSTPITARLCTQMMDDLFKVCAPRPERTEKDMRRDEILCFSAIIAGAFG